MTCPWYNFRYFSQEKDSCNIDYENLASVVLQVLRI